MIVIITLSVFIAFEAALTLLLVGRKIASGKRPKHRKEVAPSFYITGNKPLEFKALALFCENNRTKRRDVLIVLGDGGINSYGDDRLKAGLTKLDITIACLQTNNNDRTDGAVAYGICDFCGGKAYYEPGHPNIFFLIDGEVYKFGRYEYLVAGGALSTGKPHLPGRKGLYFRGEVPGDSVRYRVEQRLSCLDHKIHGILTHTCPFKYLPREMLISVRKKPAFSCPKNSFSAEEVRATELWLERIEEKTSYDIWFCGRYRVDRKIDRIVMLYDNIIPLEPSDGTVYDR